jgi:hypothetical protein
MTASKIEIASHRCARRAIRLRVCAHVKPKLHTRSVYELTREREDQIQRVRLMTFAAANACFHDQLAVAHRARNLIAKQNSHRAFFDWLLRARHAARRIALEGSQRRSRLMSAAH